MKEGGRGVLEAVLRESQDATPGMSLTDAVERARRAGSNEHVTVEIVFSSDSDPLTEIARQGGLSAPTRIGDMSVLWIRDKPVDSEDWFLALWPSGSPSVHYLVTTVHSTDPRWKRAERWIRNTRSVLRTYLDHDVFDELAGTLSELGDVEVGRVTARMVADGSSDSRGWKADSRQGRPSLTDIVQMMDDEGATIKTLTLHVNDLLSFHLRRLSGATFYSGSFSLFADRVLNALASHASQRHMLLRDRQRRANQPSRPLEIALATGTLDNNEINALLDEVQSLPNTTVAVYHRNPYLHVALVDERDGSTFDLTVTDENSICLYPGFRVSESAISRITDALSERFGGRKLADPPSKRWTLEELSL